MVMQSTWEEAKETGRTEGTARAVLTTLRVRGLPVSAAAHARIVAEKDPAVLERWLERAIVATSGGRGHRRHELNVLGMWRVSFSPAGSKTSTTSPATTDVLASRR